MKKILSILLVVAMVMSSALGYAASTGSVTISIEIIHSADIDVTPPPEGINIDLTPGGDPVKSGKAITIENIGTGTEETISVSDNLDTVIPTGETGWSAEYQFTADTDTLPASGSWELSPSVDLSYGESSALWIRLTVPGKTSATSLGMEVTLSAAQKTSG